jgi:hypothetical protein
MPNGEILSRLFSDGTEVGEAAGAPLPAVTYADLVEAAAPADPSAGSQRVYAKADGKTYKRNSAGDEVQLLQTGDALTNPLTTAGGIVYGDTPSGGSAAPIELALGTKGKRLKAGTAAPEYGWHSIKSIGTGDWSSNNWTVTDTDGYDSFYGTTSTTNRTVTMAVGANNIGRRVTVMKNDSGSGKVTITRQGSDNFGLSSATTIELLSQGDRVTLEGDSGRWRVVEFSRKPITARYRVSASTANASLAASAREVIDYDTADYDSHSSVTTGASWVFTAKRAMVVMVAASYRLAADSDWSTAGQSWRIEVRQNGTVKYLSYSEALNTVSGSRVVAIAGSTALSLASGDTVDITALQTSGGVVSFSTSGVDDCTVSISEIPDLTL